MATDKTQPRPSYENFLNEVNPIHRDFVEQTHARLLRDGAAFKLETAKSGYVASYSDGHTGRALFNYVFRKSGMVIRIYGDSVGQYLDLLAGLPAGMQKAIDKAPVCRRMLDPAKCNSRCSMGYAFPLGDNHYQKCRFNAFMFLVNDENIPFIETFIEREQNARAAM